MQEVRIGCASCGRQSRLGTVFAEGRTTMVVNACQVVCPACSRRITVERGVFTFNPEGALPTYRPAALA